MGIITLTTDLGTEDFYVGAVKGAIYSQCSDATVVDISHDISKFNIPQAAFAVKNVYQDFPKGTIHVISVDPDHVIRRRPPPIIKAPHVAIKHNGHYFIGADNGMFALIFDQQPEQVVELTISSDSNFTTFITKDIFIKAACHIHRGGTLEVIGGKKDAVLQSIQFMPVIDYSVIRGNASHIDSYGNVITNITKQLFKEVGKGKPFIIHLRQSKYTIVEISNTYQDVVESEVLALFGSNGFLEISINKGNASELLGVYTNDMIRIEFQ